MRTIQPPFCSDRAVPFSTTKDCRCDHCGCNFAPMSWVNVSAADEGMVIRVAGEACSVGSDLSFGRNVPINVLNGVCDSVSMLVNLRCEMSAFGSSEDVSTNNR